MGRLSIGSITQVGKGYVENQYQRGVYHNLSISGLPTISYRIMIKRSDGKQEEMTILNTFSRRGGVAHLTHTNEKYLGHNYVDELSGADETCTHTS